MQHSEQMEKVTPRRSPLWQAALVVLLLGQQTLRAQEMFKEGTAGEVVMVITSVVEVMGEDVVVLGAGTADGLSQDAEVMLLREGEPITHPLTGAVLGTPQEPVGTVRVFELGEHTAKARLLKRYSAPAVDDMAEFEKTMPTTQMSAVEVQPIQGDFARRVEELEVSMQKVGKANDRIKSYPAFARRVWDEITAMRSYLMTMDERLIELEEQSKDEWRLSSVMGGFYEEIGAAGELKEFTIRYSPDTQIKLRAAGKTLLITVVNDSAIQLSEVEEAPGPVGTVEEEENGGFAALLDGLFGGGGEETLEEEGAAPEEMTPEATSSEEEGAWYEEHWQVIAGVSAILALIIMASLIIKRRYSDVMEGLDEFDDDYFDDDEDQDDEDDYEKEEGR